MAGDLPDAVGNVLKTSDNGVAPSIHSFCCGSGCGMESLNMQFQSWESEDWKDNERNCCTLKAYWLLWS